MPKKYSFPELKCRDCEHFQRIGNDLLGTRYCGGFPKRRKPKRFSSSDPQYKAPKWCPRRFPVPIIRIYGFADEESKAMDVLTRDRFDRKLDKFISVFERRYRLRLEQPLNMKAKEFFEGVGNGDLDDVLQNTDLQPGEIVEIDDGMTPYYFYCLNWSRVVPVYYFDRSSVQKGD